MFPYLQFSACRQEGERWGEASNDEDDPREKALPEDPETCLQLNMVYQEVIREKLAEVSLLLAQNREQQVGRGLAPRSPAAGPPGTRALGPLLSRGGSAAWPTGGPLCLPQEEVMWELVGCKGSRVKDSKTLPSSLYMGHFMKPYFKDKVTGVVSGAGSALIREGGQALWEGALVPTASVGVVTSPGFFGRVFPSLPKLKLPGSGVKVQVSSPGRWQLTSLHREAPGAFPGDVARGQECGVLAAEVSPWLMAVPPPSSALVESLSSPCAARWRPQPF